MEYLFNAQHYQFFFNVTLIIPKIYALLKLPSGLLKVFFKYDCFILNVLCCFAAFCKNIADNKWYTFDDTKVTEMPEEEVVTRAAYLLFYQRRNTKQCNINDLSHWIHILPRLQMKASKFKHSRSHEDLLDGKMMSVVRFESTSLTGYHGQGENFVLKTEQTFL